MMVREHSQWWCGSTPSDVLGVINKYNFLVSGSTPCDIFGVKLWDLKKSHVLIVISKSFWEHFLVYLGSGTVEQKFFWEYSQNFSGSTPRIFLWVFVGVLPRTFGEWNYGTCGNVLLNYLFLVAGLLHQERLHKLLQVALDDILLNSLVPLHLERLHSSHLSRIMGFCPVLREYR